MKATQDLRVILVERPFVSQIDMGAINDQNLAQSPQLGYESN